LLIVNIAKIGEWLPDFPSMKGLPFEDLAKKGGKSGHPREILFTRKSIATYPSYERALPAVALA